MFDFEKLDVYQVVKNHCSKILLFIFNHSAIDAYLQEQWKRSTLNIILNLAEGTGRMVNTEKRQYLTESRGNVFESVAILELIKALGLIEDDTFKEFYDGYEQISKMLLGMIRSYGV